jgi:2-dehydropantoate 2-reductase
MNILVFGTGGVGGYFGGRLASSGEHVTFIARGRHLAAMQADGLRIESALGNIHVSPVDASEDPKGAATADLVVIGVKLWDTETAAKTLEKVVGPETAVVSFQNGVDAIEILTRAFGKARVIGGVAHIAAVIDRPGVIRHNGTMQHLTFGELDGRRTPRVEKLFAACKKAGIDTVLSEDIQRVIWEKFVFLVGLSGLTTLTRLPIGAVRADPETRALLLKVMREAAAVGRARHVHLAPDAAEKQLEFTDGLPATMIASMLGDLQRGRPLELPWLSGAVVRLGEQSGVATPANRFICAALKLHSAGLPPVVKEPG